MLNRVWLLTCVNAEGFANAEAHTQRRGAEERAEAFAEESGVDVDDVSLDEVLVHAS